MYSSVEPNENPRLAAVSNLLKALRSDEVKTQPTLASTLAIVNPIIEEIRIVVGQEAADLINRFAGQPIGDLAEKRKTATAISDLLDGLGLRVKCPKTGRAAALFGQPRSDNHPDGYFKTLVGVDPQVGTCLRSLLRIEVTLRDMSRKPHRHLGSDASWER